MSLLSAAANDEDGDAISALRAENEQLRTDLAALHTTLEMTARAGARHAQAAACLRETVIRWANRAEQAENMLEAIGAGGVGKVEQPQCVDWPEVDRLLKTVKYLIGIAERGSGRKMRNDDETVEQFVLSYVRSLEQPQGEQEPVTARHRFRNPQRGTPDWSVWQPCKVEKKRPVWEIDSQGFEVEYQALYTHPQPRQADIERIQHEAAAAEREACARVAEEPVEFTSSEASRIAAAIRARGQA